MQYAIPEKILDILFTLRHSEKTWFHPWKFCEIVWDLWEISRLKTKTHGCKFHLSFSWTSLENFLLFLIHPWITTCSFCNTPSSAMSLTPHLFVYISGIAQYMLPTPPFLQNACIAQHIWMATFADFISIKELLGRLW